MDEAQLEEIDNFLYEYAVKRFNILFKFMVVGLKRFKSYVMLVVRALVRSIYHLEKEIYLKDVLEIVLAEADYMLNEDLMSFDFKNIARIRYSEEFQNMIKSEIHRWIIYLTENNKVPANFSYDRFLGRLSVL